MDRRYKHLDCEARGVVLRSIGTDRACVRSGGFSGVTPARPVWNWFGAQPPKETIRRWRGRRGIEPYDPRHYATRLARDRAQSQYISRTRSVTGPG